MQRSASARRVHREAQNDVHPNGPQIASPHPIHSLPPEILSQIFILTLYIDFASAAELHETSRHSERHLKIFNPLVLCAVCSSWRSLAFSTPQLWQRVLIHLPIKAQAEKWTADLIQWIERARSLPLALHVCCGICGYLDWISRKALFLSVVNDYATRWKSMYLQNLFTALQLGPSPTLPSTLFQNDNFWKITTSLLYPNHVLSYEDLPWAELTRLRSDHQISCERIFMKSPKLVQLSISVPSFPYGGPMILHNLVTFSLTMSHASRNLLNRLSLPPLRDLFLKQVSSADIQPLLNFFTRSSCSLGKLEIDGQDLSPDDLLNLLAHRSCDSLTSLKILEPPCDPATSQLKRELVDDHVLRRLALHQDDSLCPRLKFLTVDCATECSRLALLKIVESRAGCLTDWQLPDDPIQYLHLRSIKHLDDVRKIDEDEKSLKRSGMEYTRRRYREVGSDDIDDRGQYFYSVFCRKQGLQKRQLLVDHGGFFFDLDQV